jgi:hypothetical protein
MTAAAPSHKRCPRCWQPKPTRAFYKRRNGQLSAWCQDCTRAASQEARRRRRADAAELERTRAVDRARQRRYRALGRQDSEGGEAA